MHVVYLCDTWTYLFTGKSNKDKENVQLTGFDVVRQRHSSNSDNNFTQPQGVFYMLQVSCLVFIEKKIYVKKFAKPCVSPVSSVVSVKV